jgi:LPS sulfotransferase NodH
MYYSRYNKAEFDELPYDGMPGRVLIIASTPRVGSTLITRGLMSIGAIAASNEFFNSAHRRDFESRWGALSDQDYLNKLMRHRTKAGGLFAVKTHYDQFVSYAPYLEAYNLYFLFLQRHDIVRQAVSWFKGDLTRVWTSEKVSRKKLTESDYDFCAIRDKLEQINRLRDQWEAYYQKNGYSPKRIYYEELDSDYNGVICDVANNFLGMFVGRDSVPSPSLRKQRNALTEYYVSRFYTDWTLLKNKYSL